ncbi:hypothetical protein BT96DRAFT_1016387 [Gymnopus androsaceus JB14]|uniref:Uncharacterized protein n=1 Tax=Gymnopus androsaceus JB14 TaxID=1447944 RepID=A0A6A4I1U8_9AGAR|nr:hypothetical protein BT96DRAFT_1016387 [Gymnopus androsaceus JB14]
MATSRSLDAFQRFLMGKIALNPFTLNLEGYAIPDKQSVESGRQKLCILLIMLLRKKELRKHADAKIFAEFLCSPGQLKAISPLHRTFLALLAQKDSPLGNIDICVEQTFSPYVEGIGVVFGKLMRGIDLKTVLVAPMRKRPHDENMPEFPVKKTKSDRGDAKPDASPESIPSDPGPPPRLPLPPVPEPSGPIFPRQNLKDHPLAKKLLAQLEARKAALGTLNAAAAQGPSSTRSTSEEPHRQFKHVHLCSNSDPFLVPSGSGTIVPAQWLIPFKSPRKPAARKSSALAVSPTPVTGAVNELSFDPPIPSTVSPVQDAFESYPSLSFLDCSAETSSADSSSTNETMASFSSSFGSLPAGFPYQAGVAWEEADGMVKDSVSLGADAMASFVTSLVPPVDGNIVVDGNDTAPSSSSSVNIPLISRSSTSVSSVGREVDGGNQSQNFCSSSIPNNLSMLNAPPPPPPAPQGEGTEATDEVRECNSQVCLAQRAALEAILQLVRQALGLPNTES